MKKSKVVNLVLVAGLVASCSSKDDYEASNGSNSRLYVRSDTTSQYSHTSHHYGGYYHFIPFGYYQPWGGYRHGGYESSAFSSKAANHPISRGGFGHSGFKVGS